MAARGLVLVVAGAMYAVADRLDPDSLLALATAAFAESALAGFTVVGEFHYLHHAAGGRPYADPNAMGEALQRQRGTAGVRLTLLDTRATSVRWHGSAAARAYRNGSAMARPKRGRRAWRP